MKKNGVKRNLYENVCNCCSTVKSDVDESYLIKQFYKHGEYICVRCEENLNKILEGKGKSEMDGKQLLISENTVYYFEKEKIKDPKSSFLGFSGTWWLVRYYDYDMNEDFGGYTSTLTNNLWHAFNIPVSYRKKFKDKKRINTTLISLGTKNIKEIKDQLQNNVHLQF